MENNLSVVQTRVEFMDRSLKHHNIRIYGIPYLQDKTSLLGLIGIVLQSLGYSQEESVDILRSHCAGVQHQKGDNNFYNIWIMENSNVSARQKY